MLEFLQKPVVAFVRLTDSVVMDSALEIPVPVRFIFVLVGPDQSAINDQMAISYNQSGRAMGALMADWVREELQTVESLQSRLTGVLKLSVLAL